MSMDQQLEQIHDLMKEMRAEQRLHRADTTELMAQAVQFNADLESLLGSSRLKGRIPELEDKVELHHGVYTKGKALSSLLALLLGWVGWDTIKNHWWHK